jgi:hypothetical protein
LKSQLRQPKRALFLGQKFGLKIKKMSKQTCFSQETLRGGGDNSILWLSFAQQKAKIATRFDEMPWINF